MDALHEAAARVCMSCEALQALGMRSWIRGGYHRAYEHCERVVLHSLGPYRHVGGGVGLPAAGRLPTSDSTSPQPDKRSRQVAGRYPTAPKRYPTRTTHDAPLCCSHLPILPWKQSPFARCAGVPGAYCQEAPPCGINYPHMPPAVPPRTGCVAALSMLTLGRQRS